MATASQKLKATILREPAKFYAFRVLPGGRTVRLTPFGRKTFGVVALAWLKRRAKRLRWKIIVKRIAKSPVERKRDASLAHMRWALSREPHIHYRQARPFRVLAILKRDATITTDCSGSSTMVDRAAGWRDPNGLGFNGYGYTGTMRSHTPRKSLANCKVGDFIVYGGGTGAHVVKVFKPHPTNPVVFSHGQESGPRLYTHAQQVAAHGRTFTCHDIAAA